jgi:oxalate decarboxylase/phosphoglucose isomerase-like protein (cupin superfamily)
VLVPAGTNHNIINTGSVPMKHYTIYALPNHRDGVVHHTRAEAEADNEHFDGKTTEERKIWVTTKNILKRSPYESNRL